MHTQKKVEQNFVIKFPVNKIIFLDYKMFGNYNNIKEIAKILKMYIICKVYQNCSNTRKEQIFIKEVR